MCAPPTGGEARGRPGLWGRPAPLRPHPPVRPALFGHLRQVREDRALAKRGELISGTEFAPCYGAKGRLQLFGSPTSGVFLRVPASPRPGRPRRSTLEAATSGVASGPSPGTLGRKGRGRGPPSRSPKGEPGSASFPSGTGRQTRRRPVTCAARAAGRRARVQVQSRPGGLPAGLARGFGTALCWQGEEGPRAGAGGSRRWVPRPFSGFDVDTPFPLFSGAAGAENWLRPSRSA